MPEPLYCVRCGVKVGIRFDDGYFLAHHECLWFDATRCTPTGRALAEPPGPIMGAARWSPPRSGIRA